MRSEQLGDLRVHITGGVNREGGGDGPLVVLLHGFGAPGTDLVGLWRVLDVPSKVRFAFPEAPLSMPQLGMGRAWWMLDMAKIEQAMMSGVPRDLSGEDPPGLPAARAQVLDMLDALQEKLGVSGTKTVLGGFSQGAMLSTDIALSTDRELAGLALMSGALLAKERWMAGLGRRAGLPVFQSHGQQDMLLGFGQAEKLHELLEGAGLAASFLPFRGGHEIPMPVLERLGGFLRSTLEDAPGADE